MLIFASILFVSSYDSSYCKYSRPELLSLSERKFDQDQNDGWRRLYDLGCVEEAAEAIRVYRLAARRRRPDLLAWHEGQLRAELGQYLEAVALFKQSYRPRSRENEPWNLYVDGSIAFLIRDRVGLLAANAALADLPKPSRLPEVQVGNQIVTIPWPPNLGVLAGLLRCFSKSYKEAYACAPVNRISVDSK